MIKIKNEDRAIINNCLREKKKFTLVELLLVIAIIAILASMLLPVLQKVKAKARDIQCLGSIKQFGLKCQFYALDNNGFFAPPGTLPYAEQLVVFGEDLQEIRKFFEANYCPVNFTLIPSYNPQSGSYMFNAHVVILGWQSFRILRPSTKILMIDSHIDYIGTRSTWDSQMERWGYKHGSNKQRINCCWADLHVTTNKTLQTHDLSGELGYVNQY